MIIEIYKEVRFLSKCFEEKVNHPGRLMVQDSIVDEDNVTGFNIVKQFKNVKR